MAKSHFLQSFQIRRIVAELFRWAMVLVGFFVAAQGIILVFFKDPHKGISHLSGSQIAFALAIIVCVVVLPAALGFFFLNKNYLWGLRLVAAVCWMIGAHQAYKIHALYQASKGVLGLSSWHELPQALADVGVVVGLCCSPFVFGSLILYLGRRLYRVDQDLKKKASDQLEA